MALRVISWNLFHGRDAPPDRSLHTWRSRITRRSEQNATHIQVNRELLVEFVQVLAALEPSWEIALLQESPPRWASHLANRLGAEAHISYTSRNSFATLRAAVAHLNPDLIASAEGGSNLILVRPGAGQMLLRREIALRPGPRPERRTMSFAELDSGICVANLHATNDRPELAGRELLGAAEAATSWAGDRPLIFGGDFNLRPGENPEIFKQLEHDYGLVGATGPHSIDHILSRGLKVVEAARPLAAEQRELQEEGLRLRLSDHAPVGATYARD